jgi:hypothetical protein
VVITVVINYIKKRVGNGGCKKKRYCNTEVVKKIGKPCLETGSDTASQQLLNKKEIHAVTANTDLRSLSKTC